jgi:ureidoacrylate peracid hydrolase
MRRGDILTTNVTFDWKEGARAKVHSERTALLVIDVQHDFCSRTGALAGLGSDVGPSEEVARKIERFLPAIRDVVGFIAFFRLVYQLDQMSESQRERLVRDGKPIICVPGTIGSELVLAPSKGDFVFVKHRYSPFSNAAFCQILKERSIENIAVSGVDTHICVEAAIRNGYDLGYRMIILPDLVGTRRSELDKYEHSLALCERYFALRVESQDFLSMLRKSAHHAGGLNG